MADGFFTATTNIHSTDCGSKIRGCMFSFLWFTWRLAYTLGQRCGQQPTQHYNIARFVASNRRMIRHATLARGEHVSRYTPWRHLPETRNDSVADLSSIGRGQVERKRSVLVDNNSRLRITNSTCGCMRSITLSFSEHIIARSRLSTAFELTTILSSCWGIVS